MKSNLLPFPSLQAAPRDPPQPSVLRALATLAVIIVCLVLLGMTFWALLG